MKKVLFVILGVILLGAFFVFGRYNSLVSADESVQEAWAQVENQYQRRLDLIDNLVNTVKGFADQEVEVFTKVVEARAKASQTNISLNDPAALAQFQQAQGEMSSALSRLLVTVEAYPELKSDTNFLALQTQLEGTENRIATERTRFNAAVRKFNTIVRTFPTNIIAGYFGFEKLSSFTADEGAKIVPKVDFGTNGGDEDGNPSEIDDMNNNAAMGSGSGNQTGATLSGASLPGSIMPNPELNPPMPTGDTMNPNQPSFSGSVQGEGMVELNPNSDPTVEEVTGMVEEILKEVMAD